jgi:2,4-diaminopentanoate dehydrogenase
MSSRANGVIVSSRLRIAHVGTGYTGSIGLRQILRSPHFELVGHLVHSRDKAGRDSGELVGESPVGVSAVNSLQDFLAIDADCVTYFATVSGRDSNEVVDQVCEFLASGKNVVTPSLFSLFHPPSLDDIAREQLEDACRRGNSSVFATGIAPGFTSDMLAVHAASMSELPTKVSVQERIPCGAYRVPGFFAMLGFGRTPEQDAEIYPHGAMIGHIGPALRLLAQGLGLTIDEIREHRDIAVAQRDYSFEAGEIPVGTIASVRMRFDGIVDGQPRVQFSSIWSMPDESVEDWQPAIAAGSITRRLTRITIDGDPPVQVDFALNGGDLPGSAATAARVLNAIPAVCAANPGILSALDVIVTAHAGSTT